MTSPEMTNRSSGILKKEIPEDFPGLFTRDFFRTVSDRPGVYLMKNRQGQILYVGKAKNLRKRVASYQRLSLKDSPKTALLLKKVETIETILTNTEKEAFILEASLIKKHCPRFNIELKDDKSYPRIKVTLGEKWPRIFMTRRRSNDGSRYFGPFASAGAMRETLSIINKLFPLRRCKDRIIRKRERPCLNYQMERCLAPCCEMVDQQDYQNMVNNVLLILEGKNRQLKHQLEKAMVEASEALEFEKAALIRDQAQALAKTLEKQIVVSNLDHDLDVFGYSRKGAGVGIAVIKVRQGVVCGQQVYFLLDPIGNDSEVLKAVLWQYYNRKEIIPDELLLPFKTVDHFPLQDWLSSKAGRSVRLKIPGRGQGLKLLRFAEQNADQIHVDQENRERNWQELARDLRKKLHLEKFPDRIECFDISNFSGKQPVGSLICFQEGEKFPKDYRHYSINGCHEPDDYRMMKEVLDRRFTGDNSLKNLPDLLLIDGGKGHLNLALQVLENTGMQEKVELAAIAKDKESRIDRIYRPGRKNPITFKPHAPALFFLMQVRDEAHRFGISFHRRLRRKSAFSSELDKISGIGSTRKKDLLKALGSLARIRKASKEELADVAGIGPELARQIYDYFHLEQ